MKKIIFSILFLGFLYFRCWLHQGITSFNLAALIQALVPFIILSILFYGKRLIEIVNVFFSRTIEENVSYLRALDTVTSIQQLATHISLIYFFTYMTVIMKNFIAADMNDIVANIINIIWIMLYMYLIKFFILVLVENKLKLKLVETENNSDL